MYFWIEWKDLEGDWIREEIAADDFEDADRKAADIAFWFGDVEHHTEIFGHNEKQSR